MNPGQIIFPRFPLRVFLRALVPWRLFHSTKRAIALQLLLLLFCAPFHAQGKEPVLNYRVEFFGNTFSGNPDWVQADARAMCVLNDGTCALNCPWDEAGHEVGFYRGGKVAGFAPGTHGWGYHGGAAITANAKYLFFAQVVDSEGGHLVDAAVWPAAGRRWLGISRRTLSGQPAPFNGGKGGAGNTAPKCFLPIDELPDEKADPTAPDLTHAADLLPGLAADDRRLFVSDAHANAIRIFDAETLKPISMFAVNQPRQIALDRDGSLWIVEGLIGERPAPSRNDRAGGASRAGLCVAHHAIDGNLLPGVFGAAQGVQAPAAIACDRFGKIFIADNGPDQQIKVFDGNAAASQPARPLETIGQRGGVLADPRGKVGPLRFNGFTAVGADARGRLYVCCNGIGNNADLGVASTGLVVQCYRPANSAADDGAAAGGARESTTGESRADWSLEWQLLGLEFVDCGDFDPANDESVYTVDQHFRLSLNDAGTNAAANGAPWSYAGYTLDRFRYPQDPRLHTSPASVFARRVDGKLLLYSTDMYANFLQVYRLAGDGTGAVAGEGQTAIPCGFFAPRHWTEGAWPPFQPPRGEWIWRDANGDGTFGSDEFQPRLFDAPRTWGWCVDSAGDVWQANIKNVIRHFSCAGLDAHGAPIYSFKSMTESPGPAPFTSLHRLEYVPATDTMYLAGYTNELREGANDWKMIGKVLCRYDHWNDRRVKRWELHPAFDDAAPSDAEPNAPVAMCAAGDYVFLVYLKTAEVRIFAADTGAYVGALQPPKDASGWVDLPYGIRATKRANGEYLVIVEEDWKAKNLLYRWKP